MKKNRMKKRRGTAAKEEDEEEEEVEEEEEEEEEEVEEEEEDDDDDAVNSLPPLSSVASLGGLGCARVYRHRRIDGSVPLPRRHEYIREFNR